MRQAWLSPNGAAELQSASALLATIAHELNQPLAGAILNAGTCLTLLSAETPDIPRARETAQRMLRDSRRATNVVAALRSLFANDTDQFELVDLNLAVRDVLDWFTAEIKRHDVVVRLRLDRRIGHVHGNRIQLQQVIANLVQNAMEAMSNTAPASRHLIVGTACEGEHRVGVFVRDRGAGLATEVSDKIFEPLFTTKEGGMGLGLFYQSGHCRMPSWPFARHSKPRAGSNLFLLSAAAELRSERAHIWGKPMSGEPIVYVVDDDISVRESLEMRFASLGLRCEIFDGGRAFLSRARDACPACLVLDCRLPDLDGFEVCRLTSSTSLPVVFITAFGEVPAAVRAMKAGAIEFLTKPFSEESLVLAVREGLERSRKALAREDDMRALFACYNTLSQRERQVMALVTTGLSNKVVGARLGVSEQTVKAHRGRVMQKMKASSVADLIAKASAMRQSPDWQEH